MVTSVDSVTVKNQAGVVIASASAAKITSPSGFKLNPWGFAITGCPTDGTQLVLWISYTLGATPGNIQKQGSFTCSPNYS
jgi:hypothetical protein